ncbi:3721_t:CDS:2 [Entrophospora sp. SA101]|nr:3721_t:CDS:2 [Entrophospora sp. SA101]
MPNVTVPLEEGPLVTDIIEPTPITIPTITIMDIPNVNEIINHRISYKPTPLAEKTTSEIITATSPTITTTVNRLSPIKEESANGRKAACFAAGISFLDIDMQLILDKQT